MKPHLTAIALAYTLVVQASPAVHAQSAGSSAPTTASAPAAVGDAFDQRAAAVVQPMRLRDPDRSEAAARLTAGYLRELRKILDARQAALERVGQGTGPTPEIDKQSADAWMAGRKVAVALRDAYAAGLAALMTPYQVERVKDGITADCFPRTLQVYDEMVPGLTYPQRAHVVGLLAEMRENAMLELDADAQKQWVDKYRGIINNYIAAQGHDFTALSKAYDAKRGKN